MYRVTKSEVEGTVQNYSLRKKQSQKEEGWRKADFPSQEGFAVLNLNTQTQLLCHSLKFPLPASISAHTECDVFTATQKTFNACL